MKFTAGASLGLALFLASSTPSFAESKINSNLVGGQTINGEVTAVDGSIVTVKTTEGSSQYQLAPNTVTALKLGEGTSVTIDGSRLATGRISGLDRNTVKVTFDNGERRSFILTREERRTLVMGDRVIVSGLGEGRSIRNQNVHSLASYALTASDFRVQRAAVASASTSGTIQEVRAVEAVEAPQPTVQEVAPPPIRRTEIQAAPPVRGLW